MLWWIGAQALAFIVLFLAQGFLLQLSVAVTGEAAPKYGKAMWSAVLATILGVLASAGFALTVGLVMPASVSATVTGLLLIGVTTVVLRRQLDTTFLQALVTAVIYHVLAAGASGLAYYLITVLA